MGYLPSSACVFYAMSNCLTCYKVCALGESKVISSIFYGKSLIERFKSVSIHFEDFMGVKAFDFNSIIRENVGDNERIYSSRP